MRGYGILRSINVNAPVDGVRPDPLTGNVTRDQLDRRAGAGSNHRWLELADSEPAYLHNLMYQFTNTRNFADAPLSLPSDSINPDADWGPSADDIRHRLYVMANFPLPYNVRVGLNMRALSARPYNITTGLDDNGDAVFNDRPEGVSRNSERSAAQITATSGSPSRSTSAASWVAAPRACRWARRRRLPRPGVRPCSAALAALAAAVATARRCSSWRARTRAIASMSM